MGLSGGKEGGCRPTPLAWRKARSFPAACSVARFLATAFSFALEPSGGKESGEMRRYPRLLRKVQACPFDVPLSQLPKQEHSRGMESGQVWKYSRSGGT